MDELSSVAALCELESRAKDLSPIEHVLLLDESQALLRLAASVSEFEYQIQSDSLTDGSCQSILKWLLDYQLVDQFD